MPGTGTGRRGRRASLTPMTTKKRVMAASVLRFARRERNDSTAWKTLGVSRGRNIAKTEKQMATPTTSPSAWGTRSHRMSMNTLMEGMSFPLGIVACARRSTKEDSSTWLRNVEKRNLALDFDLGSAVGILCGRLANRPSSLAIFEKIGHFQAEIPGIGRIGQAGFEIDDSRANEFVNFTVEMLHTLGAAIAHGIEKGFALGLPFFNVFASAHSGLEDFDGGNAALGVLARKKALGNDVAEGLGKASANGLLVGQRKNSDDALDGFRGVDRVEGG